MTFKIEKASPENKRLIIGIAAPQGSGKTVSALRLATGIASRMGGKICLVDTENRRSLQYADRFNFDIINLEPPFRPERYLEAIQAADKAGYDVIIVDSMSHEHEGQGGVLEWQEEEMERMAGNDFAKREKVKMTAWIKPKRSRNKLIMGMQRTNAHLICCFRAKDKVKMQKGVDGKMETIELGIEPIAGQEFGYEMSIMMVMQQGAKGFPDWTQPYSRINDMSGKIINVFKAHKQITEETGRELFDVCKKVSEPVKVDMSAEAEAAAKEGTEALKAFWSGLSQIQRDFLLPKMEAYKAIAKAVDDSVPAFPEIPATEG